MPPPQYLDTPPASTPTSGVGSYFSYPVKSTLTSAFRRLPSGFRSSSASRSSSKPQSREPSVSRFPQPTNHDRNIAPAVPRGRAPVNLMDMQSDDDDDDFGDYEDGHGSAEVAPPRPLQLHSYTPSPRATPPPPFQPPPLTGLTLAGLSRSSSNQILSTLIAEEIRLLLPSRLELVDTWRILFSLERDGASLKTLYECCEEERGTRGGYVLVVRDEGGGIFGAYLNDAPHPSAGHYYGTGECFLWRSALLSSLTSLPSMSMLPPPPSEDTTHAVRSTTLGSPKSSFSNGTSGGLHPPDFGGTGSSTPERIRFKAFPYSGINDYMIFCEQGFLSVGGGDGHYGLWLDSALERGISSPCPTFGNEALSDDGQKFGVLGCEVWYVG